jgi:molecular chaperone Hsp33
MTTEISVETPAADSDQDFVQPFQLDRSRLRGRLVRIGPLLDTILNRHAYPEPVARLLGETIVLASILAAALKYEGIFTLQSKGDGPVSLTVADVSGSPASAGHVGRHVVRGYAGFDPDRLQAEGVDGQPARQLLGRGYLAFTVDQGQHTDRYQGIVELLGDGLDDCVRHYFHQSEQLATGLRVSVARDAAGQWRGAAIMLQALPEDDAGRHPDRKPSDLEDDWRRAMLLLSTCSEAELLDRSLPANALLYRLFHEEGPRVYARHCLEAGCRCSQQRVEQMLRGLPQAEVAEMTVDGQVVVSCEFCNSAYRFDPDQLAALYR